MLSDDTLRLTLRIVSVTGILMLVAYLIHTAFTFNGVSPESTQFAGLGLPLLFMIFLNIIVWGNPAPSRRARITTHLCNLILLIVAVLLVRVLPGMPAFLVAGCTVAITTIALHFEVNHLARNRAA